MKPTNSTKLSILFLSVFCFAFFACTTNTNPVHEKDDSVDRIQLVDPSTSIGPVENWSYSSDTNKMDDKVTYFAQCVCSKQIYFSPPYDGGSTFTLTVRKRDGVNELILDVDRGQFLTSINGDKALRLKFDSSKPITKAYFGTTDYRSTEIFIDDAPQLINLIKKSKHLMIECEFYKDGLQDIEFNVDSLEWKH